MARRARSKLVEDALFAASARYGVPYSVLNSIMQVESSGNPTARTGSYGGLFMLSDSEFRRMGGEGDILDPRANAMAGAALLASHINAFRNRFGSEPSLNDLYMIHQQGWGGYLAHRANPDRPAWENMASTAEGRARGNDWARRAIAGNIPRQFLQGRDPDSITSGEFLSIWQQRLANEPPAPSRQVETPVAERPAENVDSQIGVDLRNAFAPDPQRPGTRQPVETPPPREPGFFDRQYPIVHAMTGQDEPIGRQFLGNIFGEAGLSTNRTTNRVGAALSALGKGLASQASTSTPQISLPTPALPEQDDRAFVISPRPQRRPYA